MDDQERNKYPSLPPDYVTINMLRERWIRKQEQQKLKEKQEQEVLEETQNIEKDCKNQPHGELEVSNRFENNGPCKRVGKIGGDMSLIEEKGKGKEKMGWSGNGKVTNKWYPKKTKNNGADWKKGDGDILKINMEDTEKRQNPRPKEGLDIVEKKNGSKGVEIILKNKENLGIVGFPCGESSGTPGIGKIVSVGMTEVLPKNGVRDGSSTAQNVRRDGFRGGFRRNEDDQDEGFRGNNSLGKKMEGEVLQIDRKGNGRKRRKRKGKGDKFKQSGAEMRGLKLNEVELKSEDEISEIGNERNHIKGLHSDTGKNDTKKNRVNGKELTADTLVLKNKVANTVLAENRNDGFRGHGDRRGSFREKFENLTLTIGDRKERYLGSKVERKFGGSSCHVNFGRFVDRKMKQRDCVMVWVKKQSGAVGGEAGSMGSFDDEAGGADQ